MPPAIKGREVPGSGAGAGGSAKALLFLLLALIAGTAATLVVYKAVIEYEAKIAEAKRPEEMKLVLIAAGDLHAGLIITEADIQQVEVPAKFVHVDALTSPEFVVGAIPRERILANEYILPSRLADPNSGVGLNALVPSGMRAISLPVSNAAALSGFLMPGNKVDILVTITPEQGDPQTHTLLQNVPVLAVNGRQVEAEDQGVVTEEKGKRAKPKPQESTVAPSVTLSVTPEQAEHCAHAERKGEIILTLRSENDDEEVATVGTDSEHILGELMAPKPKAPPPKTKAKVVAAPKEDTTSLQVIRAGAKTELTIGADGSIKNNR